MKTALVDSEIVGIKIWYADGSVVKIPAETLAQDWKAAPRNGVQVVSIYDRRCFHDGRYYAQWFAGYDYYALSPTEGIVETNRPSEIPHDADVKQGSEMDKTEFRALYNRAMQDHEF